MNRLILHNHLIFRWCSYFYEQQTVCKWVISDSCYIHTHSSSFSRFPFRDLLTEVQCALYLTLLEFTSNVEDESDLEGLIEQQFEALQKAFKIPHKASEARLMVSKKHLTLFRAGKIGPFILDDVPDANTMSWLVSHFFFFGVTLRLYMLVFFFFLLFSHLLCCVNVSNLLKLYYKANRCLHVLVSSYHILNEKSAFQC